MQTAAEDQVVAVVFADNVMILFVILFSDARAELVIGIRKPEPDDIRSLRDGHDLGAVQPLLDDERLGIPAGRRRIGQGEKLMQQHILIAVPVVPPAEAQFVVELVTQHIGIVGDLCANLAGFLVEIGFVTLLEDQVQPIHVAVGVVIGPRQVPGVVPHKGPQHVQGYGMRILSALGGIQYPLVSGVQLILRPYAREIGMVESVGEQQFRRFGGPVVRRCKMAALGISDVLGATDDIHPALRIDEDPAAPDAAQAEITVRTFDIRRRQVLAASPGRQGRNFGTATPGDNPRGRFRPFRIARFLLILPRPGFQNGTLGKILFMIGFDIVFRNTAYC